MPKINRNVIITVNAQSESEADTMLGYLNEATGKVPAHKMTKLFEKIRKDPEKYIDKALKVLIFL